MSGISIKKVHLTSFSRNRKASKLETHSVQYLVPLCTVVVWIGGVDNRKRKTKNHDEQPPITIPIPHHPATFHTNNCQYSNLCHNKLISNFDISSEQALSNSHTSSYTLHTTYVESQVSSAIHTYRYTHTQNTIQYKYFI